MTINLTKHLAAAMTALVILSLQSCGKQEITDPVDAVPSGSRVITVMNLEEIASANGAGEIAGDNGLASEAEEAMSMFLPADLMRPLAAVLSAGDKGIDLHKTVMFTSSKGYTGLILKVNSRELLEEALLPYRDEQNDLDGYDAYTAGRRIIALSDELCVIAPDAATVKSVGQKKTGPVISEMAGVREFLSSENAVSSARVASDLFGKKMDGLWLCTSLRFTESSIVADLSAMQPDGKPDSIGVRIAGRIDPDVLSFVPGSSSAVIASGLQGDDAKLFGIEELLKNYFPGDITMSKSGTTLWYARPAGTITEENLFSPEVWNFAGIAQMPREEGDRALKNMQDMTHGLARLDPETNCYTMTRGDASLSYGYVDGYFLQSANGPVSLGNSNPFTQDFQGARVAAILDIPGESSLRTATGLPCGASLVMKVTDEHIHAKLTFYGNPDPLLSTFDSIPALRNVLRYITATI